MKFIFSIFIVVLFLSRFVSESHAINDALKGCIRSEHLKTIGQVKSKLNDRQYRVFLCVAKSLKGLGVEKPVKNKTVLEERVVEAFKRDNGVCIGYRDVGFCKGEMDDEYKTGIACKYKKYAEAISDPICKCKKYDKSETVGASRCDRYAEAEGDAACDIMFSENEDNQTSVFYVAIRQENKSPTRLTLYRGTLRQENAYKIDISDLKNINEEDYTELDVARLLAETTSLEVGRLERADSKILNIKASF